MRTGCRRVNAVPRLLTAISRADRGRAAVLIWSVRPWPPLRRLRAILSMSGISGNFWETTMQAFKKIKGLVVPVNRPNVDTDAIIPKQYLKSIHRTGFGPNLFDEWRYLDPGEPGQDSSKRRINPDFVLNQARYKGAQILLGRDNFGCGSSREHAVWAMVDYGIRAVIAPSFADIFFNNSFKNGMLPVVLDPKTIESLFAETEAAPG